MKTYSKEEVKNFDERYQQHRIFPFKFKLEKEGNVFKPMYCLRLNKSAVKNRDVKSISIGYCKFKREDGVLMGYLDWGFSVSRVYVYENPPKIQKNEFIIKTTKTYSDIKLNQINEYSCTFTELK